MPRAQFRDSVMMRSLSGSLYVPPIAASVALYDVGTSTKIGEAIYVDDTSSATLNNPFPPGTDGAITFWLAEERELDVVVACSGYTSVRTTVTTDSAGGGGLTLPLTQTLLWSPDNTYDIGASGASRPKNVYVAGDVVGSGSVTAGNGDLSLNSGWDTFFHRQSAGVMEVHNSAILFGGLTFNSDNANDIGAAGSNRPRNIYAASGVYPGNGTAQGPGHWGGTGTPATGLGAVGDYYFRSDTPSTANQRIYIKTATSVWTGIV
jgi:hypothetical protein